MMVLMVLFWVGIVVLAVWLVRGLFPPPSPRAREQTDARTILAQRYARGEISREEYDRMLADLLR